MAQGELLILLERYCVKSILLVLHGACLCTSAGVNEVLSHDEDVVACSAWIGAEGRGA